ncbi:MAG: 1-deoxy-D-xylulose-5-phosphate reductoisomerase [Deltaproteobacteria bacterium]|nr:MAG: 1-deoxy-D-xylulose-5-phosphate reductoisomerase [Deltaproteobacteria bacterium]
MAEALATKQIAVLGSTGSIGVSSLKVIRAAPERYRVVALAAGRNLDLLLEQVAVFRPEVVSIADEDLADLLRQRFGRDGKPEVLSGADGLVRLATLEGVDTVISAVTGAAGLMPTYRAVCAGKCVALANKETMVMAGPLVMAEAGKRGNPILPIDSEHSAILQSLQGHPREDVKRVILTASGGPFREKSMEAMRRATPQQALNHPNWDMGPKISIDSATMMNKGLEIIEARWLFDLHMDQIGILIHPQSIVHSMVEYRDGSILAQMGIPDMITPISYALSYPRHIETRLPPLDLAGADALTFELPDMEKFRCLELALQAAEQGGSAPAVLNGANEIAVAAFLDGRIGLLDIPDLIDGVLQAHEPRSIDEIGAVMEADAWARKKARDFLERAFAG